MTQEKKFDNPTKPGDRSKKTDDKKIIKRNKDEQPTKIVIRHLPPTLTEETFLEQISPVPEHDYFQFVKADFSFGLHSFTRAYINFIKDEDILIFQEKFDNYIFLDAKGNEYAAIVEYAPFPKRPKKKTKKNDSKNGTIEQDPEYLKFLEKLKNPVLEPLPAPETILDEIETRNRELKANKGVLKKTTPLIDYLKKRKDDKKVAILKLQQERKKREVERRKQREDERRRRRDKDREKQKDRDRDRQKYGDKEHHHGNKEDRDNSDEQSTPGKVVLLKNPDRDRKDSGDSSSRARGREGSQGTVTTDSRGKEARGDAGRDWDDHADSRPKDNVSKYKDTGGKYKDTGGKFKDTGTKFKDTKYKEYDTKYKDNGGKFKDGGSRFRDKEKWKESESSWKDREKEKAARGKNKSGREGGSGRGAARYDTEKDRYRDSGKPQSGFGKKDTPDKTRGKYGKSDKEEKPGSSSGAAGPFVEEKGDHSKRDRQGSAPTEGAKQSQESETPEVKKTAVKSTESKSRSEDNDTKSSSKGEHDKTKTETGGADSDRSNEDAKSSSKDREEEEGRDSKESRRKLRYRDRPERAIYNPGQRAAQRRKEMEASRSQSKDSVESSQSPERSEP